MGWIGSLLIVAGFATPNVEGFDPFAVATAVGAHEFGPGSDRNFDRLPDGWTRRTGPGFPGYVDVMLDGSSGHTAPGSLWFGVNGARAAVYSSPALIDAGHHYVFEGYVRTQRLRGDAAVCSVSILDYRRQRLARFVTEPVSGTHSDWVRVRVGPIAPVPGQRFLVIGCHLVQSGAPDLDGEVWFDDLRVGGTPVLALTGKDARFRRPAEPTTLVVTATGLDPDVPYRLSLALQDVDGKDLARVERAILRPKAEGADAQPVVEQWAIPGADHGFYRFEADLRREEGTVARSESTFVVTDSAPPTIDSPFGWSVGELPAAMTADEFALAASEAGISRVKLPLWRGSSDRAEVARAVDLLERLAERQVATVGLLDPPPDELRRKFSADWTGTGEVFRLRPDVWSAALEPVIARHGARVRHWQLGRDGDPSFSELPDLAGTVAAVREQFDRVGQNTRIGVPWPADRPVPELGNAFSSVLHDAASSDSTWRAGVTEVWTAVRPSPARDEPKERGADLVRRVVEARASGASAVFVTDVLDPQTGLLRPDGAPTELYLPWRTTAATLRNSSDLGPIATAPGTRSRAFELGDSATVVLWSDEPRTEELTPGGSPSLLDIWGRPTKLETDAATGRCSVPVGPSPVFVIGASASLLRWQMRAGFEQPRLRSQHGPQPQAVVGMNPFSQGVSGTVTLSGPEGWEIEPNRWPLRLAAGESFRLPLMITLPADASLGPHDLSVEFDIQADRPYRFAVRKELVVGLGDVDIEVTEVRLPDGRLEVVQTITNRTSPAEVLNLRCDLFVPGMQRQRQYVVKLGPGRDTKRYRLPSANSLEGEDLWLRAEQENGRRVLNYRWTVGKDG